MFSSKIRVTAGLLVMFLGASALSACGDSAKKAEPPKPLPKEWSSAGKKEVKDLAAKMRGKDSAECNNIGFIKPQGLEASYNRYKWRIAPRAIGDCDAFNDVLEIAVFASSADREEFVNERTNGLCRRGFAVDAPLPAFQWATGPKWAIQGDSRGGVVKVAKRLGGVADTRPCSKKITLGWTRPGIATVRRVSALITGAKIECLGFALLERDDVIQGDPVGMAPAALGACLDAAKRPMLIGAFGAKSKSLKQFTSEILSNQQACSQAVQAVQGPDWVAIVPIGVAPAVVTATGGTLGATCGA